MAKTLQFSLDGTPTTFEFSHCTVAGWTGRDQSAIQHHINELAALGVTPPSNVPLYYRVTRGILTQAPVIEVVGRGSSGEVEPFIVAQAGALYLGLASDHTDRELESHSVALSKQICPKPVAGELWRFEDVADHLERLELRSWIQESDGDDWTLYQCGTLAAICPLDRLIADAGICQAAGNGSVAGLLCGTLGVTDGVRPARAFRMALHDPVRDRTIKHGYEVIELPVVA
ncbi:MAG: DUF2848 domain-containing protein [Salinisphaera sp.]|jgi:hypothetical protein|nr:DUF2848 domain-containing protein [Salinisphaera sp.]